MERFSQENRIERFNQDHLAVIERALQEGGEFRAYRSGAGFREAIVEINGERRGHSQGHHFNHAVSDLAEELRLGSDLYDDVYGPSKKKAAPGNVGTNGKLDEILLRGGNMKAFFQDGFFVFEIRSQGDYEIPDKIFSDLKRGRKLVARWTCARGLTWEAKMKGMFCLYRVIEAPAGRNNITSGYWECMQRGFGFRLREAMKAALDADAFDVPK